MATDQRGFGRIQDGNDDGTAAIDIGEVEKGRSPADDATDVPVDTNLVIDFGAGVQKGATGNIVIKRSSDDAVVQTIAVTSAQVTTSPNGQAKIIRRPISGA